MDKLHRLPYNIWIRSREQYSFPCNHTAFLTVCRPSLEKKQRYFSDKFKGCFSATCECWLVCVSADQGGLWLHQETILGDVIRWHYGSILQSACLRSLIVSEIRFFTVKLWRAAFVNLCNTLRQTIGQVCRGVKQTGIELLFQAHILNTTTSITFCV